MKSRKAREEAHRNERNANVKHYGCCALMWKNNAMSRSTKEMMRTIDAKEAEKNMGRRSWNTSMNLLMPRLEMCLNQIM